MRKAHMQAVIDALKERNDDLTTTRRTELAALHAKADTISGDIAALRRDVAGHGKALARHADDLSGLAEAVRNSLLTAAAPGPAPEPTPIAARRGSKAAG